MSKPRVHPMNVGSSSCASAPMATSLAMALAQQMFLLQIGHHGGLWLADEEKNLDAQRAGYEKIARQALLAAEAFITESRKEKP